MRLHSFSCRSRPASTTSLCSLIIPLSVSTIAAAILGSIVSATGSMSISTYGSSASVSTKISSVSIVS